MYKKYTLSATNNGRLPEGSRPLFVYLQLCFQKVLGFRFIGRRGGIFYRGNQPTKICTQQSLPELSAAQPTPMPVYVLPRILAR